MHDVKNKREAIDKVIDTVGLKAESGKKIGQLSKGYKQRVGLAAALIHDPEVLILDEPTSGLDPNQIIEIRDVIKQQGKNKTVLFSSHILQEVEAICDRVIIIHKGNLVADDSLSSLRGKTAADVVKVCFKESIEQSVLQNLGAAKTVNSLPNQEWKISTDNPQELRKQIMGLALQKNLNIISMHSENQSLEEVFRALTGKNAE